MSTIINYQMSVFGDFMSYEPSLERMSALAKTPAELNLTLIPSTVDMISFDGAISPNGKMIAPQTLQRIQMIDTNQKMSLAVMLDRIDVNFLQANNEKAEQLQAISVEVLKLLKHAISVIGAKYWRISINLVNQINDDTPNGATVSTLFKALTQPLSHQVGKESIEWQIISNCPQDVSLGTGQNEKLNVITAISRQTNFETNNPCVITQFDVNTSVANRTYRFNADKLETFYSSALEIIMNLINDIEEKCKNE
jgi:hypothetical protein